MKSLSNEQKEQIIIYAYEKDLYPLNMFSFPHGVNVTLEALGYDDRVKFDAREGILVWSKWYDY